MIIFLKRLSKIFKSLGKYEEKILDKITFIERNIKTNINDGDILKIERHLNDKKYYPKKIAVTICFNFNKKNLKTLLNVCNNINEFNFPKDITIVTNKIQTKDYNLLKNTIKKKIKKINFTQINNNPEPNLLPWFCFDILKQKYNNKSFSHYLFLEDDILISSKNINYWLCSREILKRYKLIPAFLRCEFYKNQIFSVDNISSININKVPKIISNSKKNGFLNLKYPYHAACLMDNDLMKEYTTSNLINIDYGFHHRIMKKLYPIKELANIIIGYINVPTGFFNRYCLPFLDRNKIPSYSIIRHYGHKYSSMSNSPFGKINIKHLLK